MKNKKLYITLFALSIIFLGIGGTFAYLTASVTATNITQIKAGNLTMTVDGGGNTNTSFMPAKCTSEYAIKKKIVATSTNTSGGKVSFSIGMNVATLSDSLKTSTMKYALTTTEDSCTNGLIANGNFKNTTVGSDIWIVKNDYDNITQTSNTYTKTYYLYIWLDEKETENISSGNISVNMKGNSSNNPNLTTEAVKTLTLYETIKKAADTITTIDFSKTSEASSTKGIYMTTDTEGNVPVYYYRGNVDNHVLFANYCWRIVRTTETGGVKLIYNGVQKDVYETTVPIEESSYINVTNDVTYPYTFDSTNKTWTSTNSMTGTITFSVAEAGNYILSYVVSFESDYDKALFYKNGTKLEEHSGTEEGQIILDGLTTSDVIKVEYTTDNDDLSDSDTVTFSMNKAVGEAIKSCNNTGSNSTIGKSAFNNNHNDNAYVGYMYGTTGSSTYASTHANTNDSTIKGVIDTWYHDNMTSYTSQLEDTVWCNDRSIVTDLANSNGGNYSSYTTLGYGTNKTLYGPASRVGDNVSNPTPTLECYQDNDKFTVDASNGNGALTYPVGLITADEIVYAGGVYGTSNSSFYLDTGKKSVGFWALSPWFFYLGASEFSLNSDGLLSTDPVITIIVGVRPSVSLKPGIGMTGGGSGTATDPFIVN